MEEKTSEVHAGFKCLETSKTMNGFLSSLPSLWSAVSGDEDGWENGAGAGRKADKPEAWRRWKGEA